VSRAKRIGLVGALAAVTSWGANSVILKFLTGQMSIELLNASRIVIAGSFFLIIFAFLRRGKGLPQLEARDWLAIAGIGFIGTSVYQLLFANGIKLSNASITALISSTNPIWVGILGAFLGLGFTRWQFIGVPVTMIGVGLLSYSSILGANVQPLGVALLITSNMCWSVYTVMSRGLMQKVGALEFTCLSFVFGGLPFVLFSLPAWSGAAVVPSTTWLWVVLSALIAQVIGFMGWFLGTQALGAARVSVFLNITPLVGVALAATFLGERITLEKILAGIIILFGVWLANRPLT
jgi:drug/metabolite transporter (DMT)-like permease